MHKLAVKVATVALAVSALSAGIPAHAAVRGAAVAAARAYPVYCVSVGAPLPKICE